LPIVNFRLPIADARGSSIADCQFPIADFYARRSPQSAIGNQKSAIALLRLFVISVLAATTAEFAELQPVRRCLLVLSRNVVATLANRALKHNVVSWHKLFPISHCRLPILFSTRRLPP
jgi:hypothetical protein